MMLKFLAVTMLMGSAWADSPAQFALRDTVGAIHHQDEWQNKKAVVVFFTTIDCPLSNGDVPEMNRIRHDYEARGVAFYAVEAETTVTDAEVQKHASEYGFTFPVLIDPRQALVKMTGATIIPEAAVLTSSGKLLYLGRIDNRVEDFDKRRPAATEFDLRDALDATLAGKPVARARTKAFGCSINLVK